MDSKTSTGGLKEFKDSGGVAPLSKEDAQKIDAAYKRIDERKLNLKNIRRKGINIWTSLKRGFSDFIWKLKQK